jgi:UDP-2-acetamido-3-amino-2,3-dideoxy-glucuronate N-acetyltransferase
MPPGQVDHFVHETAVVESGACIGPGARIWHHAHVREGSTIGAHCVVGKNVFIDKGVHIGARCKIQNNVSVFNGVTIEDDVFVGPSAVFTNDRYPRATSVDWEVVPTLVRRGASIGANATIVCGIEVGAWATVAAGAVLTKSTDDHELVAGNPAIRVGWVCECGRVAARSRARPNDLRCQQCRAKGRPGG